MKNNTMLLLGGGAVALYLITRPAAAPGTTTNPLNSLLPAAVPTTYGVAMANPAGGASLASNYAQLVAANPNLANPNYQLTQAQAQQYAANYADISQGVATWPGGLSQANLQKHWTLYGVAQKRIFLPLQPPSGSPYIPPPANPKSSGSSSWVSTALQVAGSVAVAVLGVDNRLNDEECRLVFTAAAIFKDLLPMYRANNQTTVNTIDAQLNNLLQQYS